MFSFFKKSENLTFRIVDAVLMDEREDSIERVYNKDQLSDKDRDVAAIFGAYRDGPTSQCWVMNGNHLTPVTSDMRKSPLPDPGKIILLETEEKKVEGINITLPSLLLPGHDFTGALRMRAACCEEDVVVVIADADDGDKTYAVKTTAAGQKKFLTSIFQHSSLIQGHGCISNYPCIAFAGTDMRPANDDLRSILLAGFERARGNNPPAISDAKKLLAFKYAYGIADCAPRRNAFGAAYRG